MNFLINPLFNFLKTKNKLFHQIIYRIIGISIITFFILFILKTENTVFISFAAAYLLMILFFFVFGIPSKNSNTEYLYLSQNIFILYNAATINTFLTLDSLIKGHMQSAIIYSLFVFISGVLYFSYRKLLKSKSNK